MKYNKPKLFSNNLTPEFATECHSGTTATIDGTCNSGPGINPNAACEDGGIAGGPTTEGITCKEGTFAQNNDSGNAACSTGENAINKSKGGVHCDIGNSAPAGSADFACFVGAFPI